MGLTTIVIPRRRVNRLVSSAGCRGGNVERTSFGSGASLDLYLLDPTADSNDNNSTKGTSTLLGSFSFTDGDLVFTGAEAAPEPSSYALGIAAVMLFVVLRRRQVLSSQA